MRLALALLGLLPTVREETGRPEDLQVGHWVEIRGEHASGVLDAAVVEVLEPAEHEEIIGTVEVDLDAGRRFRVLGQEVHTSEKTEWSTERGPLAGRLVKIEGRYRGPRKFSARKIRARKGGRPRITGRVDAIERTDDGLELRVMRYRVRVDDATEVRLARPLAELATVPRRFAPVAVEDVDEDDLFGAGIRLADDLSFTGQVEAKTAHERELDLNPNDDEDRDDLSTSFRGRLRWEPDGPLYGMATFRTTLRYRDDDEDGTDTSTRSRLSETFLRWQPDDRPLWVALGRHDFDDAREWVYDQNLDGVRAGYAGPSAAAELSLTTTLSNGSPRDEDTTNVIAYVSNDDGDRHLAGYVVHRDVSGVADDATTHLGVRALGEWLDSDVDSWAELAHVTGDRAGADVEAWGVDVGATWEPDFAEPLALTAGWALGTGDGAPGGTDRTFRQTGLQDNNAKFAGVTSFRYYGELVDPELANLGVLTLGVGARLAERTSLDAVWHLYWQDHAVDRLVDTELDRRPTGLDPDLGWELDLILGSREWAAWDLELVGGWFRPGEAFDNDEDAYVAKFQIRYRF